ncbi:beta-mannosidase [Paenibacillus sp. 598K]|uniref:beta-mannosidase n=1 Tax=Paenibacillus sp. 598K TaxID=1117987 RepID=UPI000FF91469|nr:glycoside hydrolase family 2 protein [Paenibacillus sp. 598K]GBF74963.1 beta-mannosidase [Paenibacillus sp. 598K]
MKRTTMLTGTWQLTGERGDVGEGPAGGTIAIEAQVPGHVHQDLLGAGLIRDPGYRKQADECGWVEHWQWTYRREFHIDRHGGGRPVLEFDGLDTYADIYLNGTLLARTDNMFIGYRFDVTELLQVGSNELAVRFRTVADGIAGKPYVGRSAAFTSERLYVRRMQCTFGWDWVGRLVSYGIWRPVRLVFEDLAVIEDLHVYTKSIDGRGASIGITVETSNRNELVQPLRLEVKLLDPSGREVWACSRQLHRDRLELTADLAEPELWWPTGYGEQPLYRTIARLVDERGRVVDVRECAFGIRTVRIEQLPDRPGSEEARTTERLRAAGAEWDRNGERPGSSFALLVNSVAIYCKGANWVPCDPFPSRVPAAHYEHLLRLARDAGMTMLRCWGGGIYEPEPFWEACDRLGMLVSQDFMMACGTYPEEDAQWMASLAVETEGIIRALRNHPSLVWWNGDNENGMFGNEEDPAYIGRAIAERVTGRLCAELDPLRPFLPTSPYGGATNNSLTIGTAHYTGVLLEMIDVFRKTDLRDYQAYFAGLLSRFCPEFPMFGAPELHTLRRFMSEEDLADPAFDMLEYHTKNHPGLVDFSLFRALRTLADKLTPPSASIAEQIRKMSYVQHELTRLVVEAYRRQRPYTGGILFWMFNDCWPASGWSLVDYYGYPKGGYYGFKQAARPVIASVERSEADGRYAFWVCSDLPHEVRGTAKLRIVKLDDAAGAAAGWEREIAFALGAGTSAAILTEPLDALDALLLDDRRIAIMDIAGPFGAERCIYFAGIPADMRLRPSGARIEARVGDAERGEVTVVADRYAKSVLLHGAYLFSDNYFDLLPGERRTIRYDKSGAMESLTGGGEQAIELFSWN